METVIDQLERKYSDFEKSEGFHLFYMSIYRYFDFIERIPEIKKIIENEAEKIHKDELEINTDETLSDDDKDLHIGKTGAFNFWGSYWRLYCKVYKPIKSFRESRLPQDKQGSIALLLMNIKTPKRLVLVDRLFFGFALGKKYVTNESILRKNYELRMKRLYPADMKKIHSLLIDKLSEIEIPSSMSKKELSFERENSILKINDYEVRIKLKNDRPNSHYVLEYIFDNKEGLKAQSFYTDILESKFQNEKMDWHSIYRACQDINNKVSKQTSIKEFLLIKTGKSGFTHIHSEYL